MLSTETGARPPARSAHASCTRSRMRSSPTAPSSPSSRRVTSARRSRRSRRSFTRRPRTPLLRLRHRDDRRAGEPDRRLPALLLAQGAGRRRGSDRALELPVDDVDLEARSGARGRLLRGPQTRPADPADGDSPGRARCRGRLPTRDDQHRDRRRPDDGRLSGPPPWSRQDRLHGLDEDRRRDHASRLRAGKADHARARGKSPNLVFADADLTSAIPSSAWAIYYAAGQSCEARSAARREADLRRGRLQDGRARRLDTRRRPARRRDPDGVAHLHRAPRASTVTSSGEPARVPKSWQVVRFPRAQARSIRRPSSPRRTSSRSRRRRSSARS